MSVRETPPVQDQVPQTEVDRAHARQTVERSAPQQTPDRPRFSRRAVAIGSGVVAVALTAGVALGLSGGEKDTTGPDKTPSTSAPADPSDQAPASTEAQVGVPGDTLENISVKPSQELIDQALQPVTVAEYPTPEAALEQISRIENVIYLSGTVETESGSSEFPETPESIALRDQLWSNILSDEGFANVDYKNNNLRQIIAMELWYLNESDAGSSKTGTWHHDWEVESVTPSSDTTFTANVKSTTTTNFLELDSLVQQNLPNIAPVVTEYYEVTFHNDGTRWVMDDKDAIS